MCLLFLGNASCDNLHKELNGHLSYWRLWIYRLANCLRVSRMQLDTRIILICSRANLQVIHSLSYPGSGIFLIAPETLDQRYYSERIHLFLSCHLIQVVLNLSPDIT
jgi:hypothetical protein